MPNRITTWQPKHQQHVSDSIIFSISGPIFQRSVHVRVPKGPTKKFRRLAVRDFYRPNALPVTQPKTVWLHGLDVCYPTENETETGVSASFFSFSDSLAARHRLTFTSDDCLRDLLLRSEVEILGQHRHDGRHLFHAGRVRVRRLRLVLVRHLAIDARQQSNELHLAPAAVFVHHLMQRLDEPRAFLGVIPRQIPCQQTNKQTNRGLT